MFYVIDSQRIAVGDVLRSVLIRTSFGRAKFTMELARLDPPKSTSTGAPDGRARSLCATEETNGRPSQ